MNTLLISAFEPFGKYDINSSSIVLDILPQVIDNINVKKIILPVVYGKAFDILLKYANEIKPDYIICMGQAGGRKSILLERIAVNVNNSEASDNSGTILRDKTIIQDGNAAYMTKIPVLDMLLECNSAIARTSYSAGAFVCNDIFYRCLHHYVENKDVNVGFLHLPYTQHFGKMPFIDSNEQADSIVKMISALGDKNG